MVRAGRRKRDSECCVRRNISLPAELDRHADPLVAILGYAGLSDYVQDHLRRDLQAKNLLPVTTA